MEKTRLVNYIKAHDNFEGMSNKAMTIYVKLSIDFGEGSIGGNKDGLAAASYRGLKKVCKKKMLNKKYAMFRKQYNKYVIDQNREILEYAKEQNRKGFQKAIISIKY